MSVCVCARARVYIYIYQHIHICIFIHLVQVYMNRSIYACMHACIHAYMHTPATTHAHTHARTHTHTHTVNAQLKQYVHAYVYTDKIYPTLWHMSRMILQPRCYFPPLIPALTNKIKTNCLWGGEATSPPYQGVYYYQLV
jgi:hypothetical protein